MPVARLREKADLKDALNMMMELGVRRVFGSARRFLSYRRLINFLFSPAILEEMRDSPERVTQHKLSEVEPGSATAVGESLSVEEAAKLIRPGTEDCLVCGKWVATPWDLVVKPLVMKRLRFERKAESRARV